MDSAKLNDWMQVVGIFALVASLIFVGLQMKQSHEIALSEAFQARTDTSVEFAIATADSPLFVSAMSKGISTNSEPLTVAENFAALRYAQAFLLLAENFHFQYVNGFISEQRWNGGMKTLESMLSRANPMPVRAVYEANPDRWDNDFGRVVEDLISKLDQAEDAK